MSFDKLNELYDEEVELAGRYRRERDKLMRQMAEAQKILERTCWERDEARTYAEEANKIALAAQAGEDKANAQIAALRAALECWVRPPKSEMAGGGTISMAQFYADIKRAEKALSDTAAAAEAHDAAIREKVLLELEKQSQEEEWKYRALRAEREYRELVQRDEQHDAAVRNEAFRDSMKIAAAGCRREAVEVTGPDNEVYNQACEDCAARMEQLPAELCLTDRDKRKRAEEGGE